MLGHLVDWSSCATPMIHRLLVVRLFQSISTKIELISSPWFLLMLRGDVGVSWTAPLRKKRFASVKDERLWMERNGGSDRNNVTRGKRIQKTWSREERSGEDGEEKRVREDRWSKEGRERGKEERSEHPETHLTFRRELSSGIQQGNKRDAALLIHIKQVTTVIERNTCPSLFVFFLI